MPSRWLVHGTKPVLLEFDRAAGVSTRQGSDVGSGRPFEHKTAVGEMSPTSSTPPSGSAEREAVPTKRRVLRSRLQHEVR